uniref:Uncharacterized protein n=1 Tax=Electrophorus electricus TaxID=8005 RepID=A0A4W4GPF1_ELEEL
MGKGQNHIPTKEEMVQHYHRVSTIIQVLQSRFPQSRNLNCVALCEGTGKIMFSLDKLTKGTKMVRWEMPTLHTRVRIQREILQVIGTLSK